MLTLCMPMRVMIGISLCKLLIGYILLGRFYSNAGARVLWEVPT